MTEDEQKRLPYVVFKRGDSGTYGMRFTLPDRDDPNGKRSPQYRIGLSTKDETEAYAKAAREYERASIRHEEGLMVGPARFSNVSASYLKKLFAEAKSEGNKRKFKNAMHAKGTVEKYLDPQFGHLAIGAIRTDRIEQYKAWRRTYWTSGAWKKRKDKTYKRNGEDVKWVPQKGKTSDATIKREFNFLRGVFKHAVDKGYIRKSDVPEIKMGKENFKPRPAFTETEFAKLEQVAIQRYYDACNQTIEAKNNQEYEKRLSAKNKLIFERKQMVEFINIAVKTGMRPGELFNMKWGHVIGLDSVPLGPLEDRDIRIYAEGKNKEGYVIPVAHTANHFLALGELFKERFGAYPKAKDTVFCSAYGKSIGTLNRQVNQLLKAANLMYDVSGKNKFSTYSFRHSYATWKLQDEEVIGIHTLAINMRTSVEMIQKYYSKLKAEQKAPQLRGKPFGSLSSGAPSQSSGKSTKFGDWENEE